MCLVYIKTMELKLEVYCKFFKVYVGKRSIPAFVDIYDYFFLKDGYFFEVTFLKICCDFQVFMDVT